MSKFQFRNSPFKIIFSLYFIFVLAFAFLYTMPFSLNKPLSFVDAFFLSSSAISTTGLSTIVVKEHLTFLGQFLLLCEIQMGGIGIMAILASLFILFKRNTPLPFQTLMSFDQNQKNTHSIGKLMIFIVCYALTIEFLCFLILLPSVMQHVQGGYGIFVALFHAVSSFTNAGFDLFGDGLYSFVGNYNVLLTTSFLIFMGGIGFPIILEALYSKNKKKSLYFKTNILTNSLLIVIGMATFFFIDFIKNPGYSLGEKIVNSLFFSISTRNAGFATTDISFFSFSSILMMMILMFIGASPSSCGGGIRTSTFAVIIAKLWSTIKGSSETHMFKKTLHTDDINKAFLIFFSFLFLFFFSVFSLCLVEDFGPLAMSYEIMSSLSTTGLSMGITADLTSFSKIWLSLLMVLGRIGIMAVIYTFIEPKISTIKFSKESIIIG